MSDSKAPHPAVIVGIDGSDAAIRAAEWAVDEAISREVPLRLVAVIPQQAEPAPLVSVGNIPMEFEYAETALRIASAAVEAVGKPVKVETAILQGDLAATFIAESRNAAMLCVGSVGIGRFARAFLGSTAADLAEAAHCPVAIIRSQHRHSKPDSLLIVVAINDSPDQDDVVEQAMREAELRDAPVLALGVLQKDTGDMPSDELNRRVQCWGRRHPGVKIYAGSTRTEIAEFLPVMDRTIQLAVIGATDADQVSRLLGPHRHPILGHAQCSVLIVRS
jgi:nucleotide-binding universal stress UspA family protein